MGVGGAANYGNFYPSTCNLLEGKGGLQVVQGYSTLPTRKTVTLFLDRRWSGSDRYAGRGSRWSLIARSELALTNGQCERTRNGANIDPIVEIPGAGGLRIIEA
ncbi:hypothetical protein ABW19_dt0205941 [Dactylella cylindrospora]|nr:hypothetical protein ABW19_dt0205941 [Dactylella cylindrospora]